MTTKNHTAFIAQSGIIAAMYIVLTFVAQPISFGAVQVRISEALCVLPVFTMSALPGLAVGCFLANLLSGATMADVLFGSLATLLGTVGTYILRERRPYHLLPPIICNAIIVPLVLIYAYGTAIAYPLLVISIAAGEIVGVGVLGSMLQVMIERHGLLTRLIR